MAGYADDFSKSNNALDAEARGLMTASAIARKIGHGATAAGVKVVLRRAEWHHTSKMYNPVGYYDYDAAVEDAAEHGRDVAAEIIAASAKPAATEQTIANARVEWLEWGGTRKHPRATVRQASGCTVTYTGGEFVKVMYALTRTMRKGRETKGFKINGRAAHLVF
jgi:hypothetical protein